jgi:hypothetical protein
MVSTRDCQTRGVAGRGVDAGECFWSGRIAGWVIPFTIFFLSSSMVTVFIMTVLSEIGAVTAMRSNPVDSPGMLELGEAGSALPEGETQ